MEFACLLRYVSFLVFNYYQVQDKVEISISEELKFIAKQFFFFNLIYLCKGLVFSFQYN